MGQSNGNSVQSVDRIGIWAVKTVLTDFRLKQRVSWEWDRCYLYYDWARSIFFSFGYILLMPSYFVGVRLKVIENLIFQKSLLK